jgi:hypothetical protein
MRRLIEQKKSRISIAVCSNRQALGRDEKPDAEGEWEIDADIGVDDRQVLLLPGHVRV